ncbi:glycosyltransferase family 4 protein [Acidobacteriota bacterium]
MRIGFDVRPFLKEETGVGIYFKNLLFALSRLDKDNHYYLFSSSWKDRFSQNKIPQFERLNFRDFKFPVRLINHLWYRLGWPSLDKFFKTELDLTHSPTPLPLPTKGKKIVTVYDLFFLDFPELGNREARRHFSHKMGDSLKKADGIVTISQFTKDQVLQRFTLDAAKVHVVHLGVSHDSWTSVTQDEIETVRKRYNLPPSFILFVGAFEPRKNLIRLLEAVKTVHDTREKIPLVLVGRAGQDSTRLVTKIEELNLQEHVVFLGYMEERDLRCVYRLATLFVFPSLREGFGLPLLEAMVSHTPIAASMAPALPEILQNAALFFDPNDPEDIAEKITRLLNDEELQEALIAKGRQRVLDFSWDKTAEKTLAIYRAVAGEK